MKPSVLFGGVWEKESRAFPQRRHPGSAACVLVGLFSWANSQIEKANSSVKKQNSVRIGGLVI